MYKSCPKGQAIAISKKRRKKRWENFTGEKAIKLN